MLPPWLSDCDLTQVGYEAPLLNLPADDLIDAAPSRGRGRFKRAPEGDRPDAAPGKRRKGWRRDKHEEQPAAQQLPNEVAPRRPDAPHPDAPRDDPWRQQGLDAYVPPREEPVPPAQQRTEAPPQGLPTRNPGPPPAGFQPLGRRSGTDAPQSSELPARPQSGRPDLPPPPSLPDAPQSSTQAPERPALPDAPPQAGPPYAPAEWSAIPDAAQQASTRAPQAPAEWTAAPDAAQQGPSRGPQAPTQWTAVPDAAQQGSTRPPQAPAEWSAGPDAAQQGSTRPPQAPAEWSANPEAALQTPQAPVERPPLPDAPTRTPQGSAERPPLPDAPPQAATQAPPERPPLPDAPSRTSQGPAERSPLPDAPTRTPQDSTGRPPLPDAPPQASAERPPLPDAPAHAPQGSTERPALPDAPPQASTRGPQSAADRLSPESPARPPLPEAPTSSGGAPGHFDRHAPTEPDGPPPWLAGPRSEQGNAEQSQRPPLPEPPAPQGAPAPVEQVPPVRFEAPLGADGPPPWLASTVADEQAAAAKQAEQASGRPELPPPPGEFTEGADQGAADPARTGPIDTGAVAERRPGQATSPDRPAPLDQSRAPGPVPAQSGPLGVPMPHHTAPQAPAAEVPGPNGLPGTNWVTGPPPGVTERPESGQPQRDSGRQTPSWVPSSGAETARPSTSGRHRLPAEAMSTGEADQPPAPPQTGPHQTGPSGYAAPATGGQAPSSDELGAPAPNEPWRNAAAPTWADETVGRPAPLAGGQAPGPQQGPPQSRQPAPPPVEGPPGGYTGPHMGGPPPGGIAPAPPPALPGQWGRQPGPVVPGGPYQPGPPPSLDDVPMRRAKKSPGSGWRKAVHHVSGGAINPGLSAEELRLQELVARIRQPVRGDYRIATLSLKGGVGKTTTTMGIGSIFASIRGDRVIAVDANPDFGTLSQRVPLQTRSTVRDLLLDPSIQRYSDVRRHTSQATSRLEVLASERDPAASEAFSEEEYRAVARILQRFYNIILTDCGTGLMHSAMSGVLDLAHSLVLISSPAIDGARSAAATLDWLSLHGHDHLVRNAVVVINSPRAGSPNVGVQQLREYFLSRCRAVHIIPFDPHMSEGAEIDLHRLHKHTKRAYVELAATIADDFATDHRRYHS
nr:AAA family ATPase [Nocardia brasiliensis]